MPGSARPRRLSRLLERADRCGINAADPDLYAAITKARSAVYELLILVHHRAVRRPDGTLNQADPRHRPHRR